MTLPSLHDRLHTPQSPTIRVPVSLLRELFRALQEIPNRRLKCSGYYKDTYQLGDALETYFAYGSQELETVGMTDQPTTCPKCGVRTDMADTSEYQQRLLEAVADIAFLAGACKFYTGDSRADIQSFIDWAREFETLRTVDEYGNELYTLPSGREDYMLAVEQFARHKFGGD